MIQIPNTEIQVVNRNSGFRTFVFVNWNLFDIWNLKFGACLYKISCNDYFSVGTTIMVSSFFTFKTSATLPLFTETSSSPLEPKIARRLPSPASA